MKKILILFIYVAFTHSFSQERSDITIMKNKLTKQKDSTYINSLLKIAALYLSDNKLDSSKTYIKKALQKVEHEKQKAKVLYALGNVNYLQENFSNATINYTEALQFYNELSDTINIINTIERIAVIKYKNSNFEIANKLFLKELKMAEKVNYTEAQATSSNNIASIYVRQKRYPKALEYYLKSLNIYKKSNNKVGIAATNNNIGDVYKNLENYESAYVHYLKSLKLFEDLNFNQGIAYSKANIGRIHFLKEKYDRAIQYSYEAEKTLKSINDNYGLADVYTNLGDIYFKKRNYKKANLYFNKSIEHAKIISSQDYIQKNYKKLSNLHLINNEYKKAYSYFKKFTILKDSIFNNEKLKVISQLNIKYETEKKNQKIKLLNSESVFQSKILKLLIFGLLTLLAFVVIILIQNKEKKQAYKELVQKNLELIESEKDVSLNVLKNHKQIEVGNKTILIDVSNEDQKELLSNDLKEKLLKGLSELMDTEKIYEDKELTITKISNKLNTNKSYISHIINSEFNLNFNSYINSCRIKESIVLLTNSDYDNYSIEGISNRVGFKSKSTFNLFFKKTTGVTPSFFKQQIKEMKDS
ncbi:MAG: tetratricopeptide repeat protein [Methanosarcinales archaeon]|nr:tetratricopeptide repeat protein [Methanosarcinales archaeon]